MESTGGVLNFLLSLPFFAFSLVPPLVPFGSALPSPIEHLFNGHANRTGSTHHPLTRPFASGQQLSEKGAPAVPCRAP